MAVFFLVPFLPRLPFMLGHMVEVNGVVGIVDGISTYHTTIRKFDGTMVFIPNAIVMATKIMNYHDQPERRIDMEIFLRLDTDVDEAKQQIMTIITSDPKVLDKPAPSFFVTKADANGINIVVYCWVKNADWFGVRSELWQKIIGDLVMANKMTLSRPQQDIHLVNKDA